jgi:hypothetical protein
MPHNYMSTSLNFRKYPALPELVSGLVLGLLAKPSITQQGRIAE